MRIGNSSGDFQQIDLMLMPMIDICFQLLIFFVANMRILSPEGSFGIEMPAAAPMMNVSTVNADDAQIPPIRVRLNADKSGDLACIRIGKRKMDSFEHLRNEVRKICQAERGPAAVGVTPEVEFECDYTLKYDNVIEAVTAVTGYLSDDGKSVIRLIENVRFVPTVEAETEPPAEKEAGKSKGGEKS